MLKKISLILISLLITIVGLFFFAGNFSVLQSQILSTLYKMCIFFMILTFLVSELSKNYSQVDKLWSIMPIIYGWTVAAMSGFELRVLVMAILITVWGLRLSYNFWRVGGYSWKIWSGYEDYRWEILRQKRPFSNPIVFRVFNLLFICMYQNALILFFTLPTLAALNGTQAPARLTLWDMVLAVLALGFIVYETIADHQQYTYRREKLRRLELRDEAPQFADGFLRTGLWKYSRHPNHFAELSFWIVIYLIGSLSIPGLLNWSAGGCFLLIVLFDGSTNLTEEIAAQKYPRYAQYQTRVSRYIPWFSKKE